MNEKLEALNQFEYLFVDKDLLTKFNALNNRFSKGVVSSILIYLLLGIIVGILTIILSEEIAYLFFNISLFFLMLIFGLVILILHIPKRRLLVKQYKKLLKEKEKYKNELLLHENLQKYNRKWNIVYLIILIVVLYISLTLFVNDLITTKNTSLAPIIVLLFLGLIFIMPTLFINIKSFKRFRKRKKK